MEWTNLLVLMSIIGLSGCTTSRQEVHPRESPQKVEVGGYGLRVLATGKGHPTVVLESGLGAGIESWQKVQSKVAQFTKVVAYEHAGAGGSDPGPKPRTGRQIAKELQIALKTAAIAPPYVLVGHSIGGPYVHIFAFLYPDQVAGIVLVDPTQERSGQQDADAVAWLKLQRPETFRDLENRFERAKLSEEIRELLRVELADVMKRGAEIVTTAPRNLRDRWVSILYREEQEIMTEESLRSFATLPSVVQEEFEGLPLTLRQAQEAWPLPDVPVIVLTNSKRDTALGPVEQALEGARINVRINSCKEWLRKVPKGKVIVTDKSGHDIPNDEPELVIDAIKQVIANTKDRV
jgi:pimeloyl-ACP methyl ester carboxylesterase